MNLDTKLEAQRYSFGNFEWILQSVWNLVEAQDHSSGKCEGIAECVRNLEAQRHNTGK